MNASHTSPVVSHRARTPLRCVAAVLLLFFSAAAMAGGGGHGGGHFGGGHLGGGHIGHGAHSGHGSVGFGGWYPGPYYRAYCNRYAPDYDPRRCSGHYPYYYDRSAPYSYVPGSSAAPPEIYGSVGADPWLGNGNSGQAQSVAAGGPDGFSVRAPLLSSSEAPESLPENTRVGAGQSAPEPASGS